MKIKWLIDAFRALENDLIVSVVSVSSALSSLRLSLFSSWFRVSLSFFRLSLSFSSLIVASDSESVIETMKIVSRDLSLDSAQSQMFLKIEDYIKKKLHSLILNIEINKDDINEMKEDIENITISYRKMQELIVKQETCIDDFLCRVIHQKRTIQDLQRQVEKFSILQSALVTQTQNALTLLTMQEDQNVSVMIESFSVMSFSSLFSLLSHVFLSMTSSLLSSSTSITQSTFEEMKNILLSLDSFLLMTSSLLSSSTSITQSIIEEMKNTVSFDMSFLSYLFC